MADANTLEHDRKAIHFDVVLRGYNQQQVDTCIKDLSGEVKRIARNRDESVATSAELSKSLGYAQRELAEAKAALGRITSDPASVTAMSERVRMMMKLAEEEIEELRRKADEHGAETQAAADRYARDTRAAADKAADDLKVEARAEIERRIKETQDALAARRAEAKQALAEQEKVARDRAAELVADAERRLAEAEDEHERALHFKRDVTEKVLATNAVVQEALKQLTPAEEAEPAIAGSLT